MDFDFSVEQYTLRDEARRFLEERCPSSFVRSHLDDPASWARGLWQEMAGLGWTALAFPEAHGGLGRGFDDLVLLLGELGRALAPVPFLSSVCFAGQAILAHGSEAQRARWLPPIASGERVGALAVLDEGSTFDEGAVGMRAGRSGGRWRLEGRKRLVLDAPAADLFVVAALGEGGGPRWFVVEEGFAVEPRCGFDRTRTIGEVRFEGAPAEPLDAPGLEEGLRFATAAVCAEMVGTAEKVLDVTVAYAKVREQFGRPIGSFQAIKHKCAEMLCHLEAARAAASYAGWAVAAGAPDAALAASVAKSYCSEALAHLGGEGVQAHGGIAFTWEHDMHLYLKRLKSCEVLLGDAAYHRERIAQLAGI